MTRWLFPLVTVGLVTMNSLQSAEMQTIEPQPDRGKSSAVVVTDAPLLHTRQLFASGTGDLLQQTALLLAEVRSTIEQGGGNPDQIVKLNVVLADAGSRVAVEQALGHGFRGKAPPAVSYVVSRLPHPAAALAIDAVAIAHPVERVTLAGASGILPLGARVYVAGQAERAETLADATTRTLESLQKTLEHLGRGTEDIVQLKSFLSPMSNVAEAEGAIRAFFGDRPVPPLVWVEWQSPLIEIELIAWGGPANGDAPVTFTTPPGMTASPVYSRVATTHSNRLIYVSGLYPRDPSDETEVADVFEQLQQILTRANSDLRHLVKATYYCSTAAASTKLNELRPNYYDPARPPAASKAMVLDVGMPDRGLTLDMIAVPVK